MGAREAVDWREYVHSDPEILVGKPVIKGTRISVELILERLAYGWTEAEIFESYPHLTRTHLLAVFDFMRDSLKELSFYEITPKTG